MTPLSIDEYYDVVVSHKKDSTWDNLRLAIYHWMRDFTDRRGIRQAWDMVSDQDQNTFINKVYHSFKNNQEIDEYDMDILSGMLCSVGSISHEYDSIDDDIQQEIKETWLEIFNTKY